MISSPLRRNDLRVSRFVALERYFSAMHAISDIFRNCGNTLSCAWQVLRYFGSFLWLLLQPKAVLAANILALQSQLAACKHAIEAGKAPPPRFHQAFRILWVVLSKLLDKWEDLAQVIKPATLKKWHTVAFRLLWRWKSRPGRPEVEPAMHARIRKLSTKNPLWGANRIDQQLRLLGYEPPCDDTILKYMLKPRRPRKPSTTWLPCLHNHLDSSWAIDFFTVPTLTFRTLFVFVVLEHGRRQLRHFGITAHPSMDWAIQQLREATPFGKKPRFLFRDNDGVYGKGVRAFLDSCGIEEVRTAYRSPWQNPYAERFVGTLRREQLDHVIILNERHLERLIAEFLDRYYHTERRHQGLDGDTPFAHAKPVAFDGLAKLVSTPVLGGLHHTYQRVAA
jgi:transposase InsO family protein